MWAFTDVMQMPRSRAPPSHKPGRPILATSDQLLDKSFTNQVYIFRRDKDGEHVMSSGGCHRPSCTSCTGVGRCGRALTNRFRIPSTGRDDPVGHHKDG